MKAKGKSRLNVNDYTKGILAGDRFLLSRAITIVESNLNSDRKLADKIIEKLLSKTGNSIRIGITGAPGVGKSTFIEAFGKFLTAKNKKVAVLAVDPSSQKTKGSILGDKTRMEELSKDALAFIRPSSANRSLGGVTDSTRETILLCEAAGYEIILVETVGVGQSETAVRDMTDFFLLLMLPGSGDELQGIKKGIMEMADGVVITKSDGDNLIRAKTARRDLQNAIHLFSTPESLVATKVSLVSSLTKEGIGELWKSIEVFKNKTIENNFFYSQRERQNLNWFESKVIHRIREGILQNKKLKKEMTTLEQKIKKNKMSPNQAVINLLTNMKITLAFVLLSCQLVFGQNLSPQARLTPAMTDLFNGMPFARNNSKVIGDIYIDKHWGMTSVKLTDEKKIEWFWTRFDLNANELEIKTPTGTKAISAHSIKEFHVKDTSGIDRLFISAENFKKDGVPLVGVLEILAEGKYQLLKQYRLDIQRPNYNPALNSGTRDTEIRKAADRYYAVDGNLLKISNTKKLVASLGDQSDKVNEFIKSNHLSVKDDKDLVQIFNFYNSLLAQ